MQGECVVISLDQIPAGGSTGDGDFRRGLAEGSTGKCQKREKEEGKGKDRGACRCGPKEPSCRAVWTGFTPPLAEPPS
ncbi:MAG: hypothetical protein OXH90_05315 [Paracoccaceae bacterium]|nr:hypothetical protein [Paracoccaceae bacterium]MDE2916408.1 hypothetical protein [Paracoccaceae bacterium]